jgi:hypothetical protein
MKKLITYSLLVATVGCTDIEFPSGPVVVGGQETGSEVSLGVASTVMSVASISSPVTSGPFTVNVNVTPGATYSFQLTHINGAVLHNHGFTATQANMSIALNYSTIPVGAYDLILMDNTGRLLKVAVIIQR